MAIGAYLLQEFKGNQYPIVYYSRKLSSVEQNYDIYNKELLVVVNILKTQRVNLESYSELTIFTDYKNLLTFTTIKTLNRRQIRQLEILGEYKFQIRYTPRKENGRADALSRRLDLIEGKEVTDTLILREQNGALVYIKHLAATLHITKLGIQ